jgi:hypothetical protein
MRSDNAAAQLVLRTQSERNEAATDFVSQVGREEASIFADQKSGGVKGVTPILLALYCCIDYNGVVTDIHVSHQGTGDLKIGGIVLCCKK